MRNITKRLVCIVLTAFMLISICPLAALAAPANEFCSDAQWEDALLHQWVSYYAPYMASSNSSVDYYAAIGTGHLQGMCVDDDASYMYVSYTNGIGKIDMATGEVAGILTGFDSGLHIGCMAYYDGYIYASFEAQATHKFYIIQVDESKFYGVMDEKEEWASAVRVILLYEPTVDARDLMGDKDLNADNLAGRSEVTGHRFSNAGIDGITFGTYPGEFGKEDADTYMFVVYGTYWFGTNSAEAAVTEQNYRYDDEHTIIQCNNTSDFLNTENQSQYLLELAYTDTTTPDQNGIANARSIYYASDSILHAQKTMYVFTGNTQWGCQNFEYDKSTGDIWLATYGASNGSPAAGKYWFVIDGSKAPQTAQIQLGQNVDLTSEDVTLYGSVASRSEEDRQTIEAQAKARALRYTNLETNPTNQAEGGYYWREDDAATDTHWYDDRPELQFSTDGYLVGDIPYLKCVCGNCTGLEGKGDYLGYTAENGYDTEHMYCCGGSKYMAYGLVSLGNGYWYINGSDTMILHHYDWDTRTFTTINTSNVAGFAEEEGLNARSADELAATLAERIAKAKEDFPTRESYLPGINWSASAWSNFQAKLTAAEAALTSEDAAVLAKAIEDLKQARKDLRVGLDEFTAMATAEARMEENIYTEDTWAAYEAVCDKIGTGYPSQVLIDDKSDELAAAYDALTLKNTLQANDTALTAAGGTATGDAASGFTTTYDVAGKQYHMLTVDVAQGTSAQIYADEKLVWEGTGAVTGAPIPVSGVEQIKIVSTTADGVAGNLTRYSDPDATIKSICVEGAVINGFTAATKEYTYRVAAGGSIPTVTAEAGLGCSATVEQAYTLPGVAVITVTKADGTQTIYKVFFEEDSAINDYEYAEVYVSDVPASMIQSITTYPNRRGQDKEDERFMRDQGWQFQNVTDDAKLTGIAADGSTVNFSKGFTLHGITSYGMQNGEAELNADGSRKSDAAIKQEYVDANNLIGYSSVTFNIDGKGYTTFSAAMSPDSGRKNHAKLSCTVRFYVDGVCVKEQKMHGSSNYWGLDVEIDLTGAKTFTIQVDPENVDDIGNNSDWANGDIITFGNAKFSNYIENMPETIFISDLPDSAILGKNLNYYAKDMGYNQALMEIPNTDGTQLTFSKGITLEGTAHKGSDAAYKQPFTDSGTLSEYSRVEYNLEGLGVTTFKGTMGVTYGRKDHAQTSMTVRFYVDDVLVKEQIVHSCNANTNYDTTGRAAQIEIDLTGAKTFSIQVDPENRTEELGYTGQGVGSASDWAWGDIITIGNARLLKQVGSFDDKKACTNHSYSVGYPVDPTCTSFGYTRWTCPYCGDYTIPADSIVDKLEHTYTKLVQSDEYLAEAATCTAAAKYYLLCASCGAKGNETKAAGDPIAHTYDQEIACNDYLKTEATHSTPAVYYKSCVCGAADKSDTAATFTFGSCAEHQFYKEIATADTLKEAATCTKQAVYWKSCICGAVSTDEHDVFSYGQLAEHTYDREVVDETYLAEAANCTFHAKFYKSCACGAAGNETFTDETGALGGHIALTDKAVPATDTTTGLTEGSHCGVCQTVLVAQQVVPVLSAPGASGGEPATDPTEKPTDPTTVPGNNPHTGEDGRIVLWIGLLFMGGAVTAVMTVLRRKGYSL